MRGAGEPKPDDRLQAPPGDRAGCEAGWLSVLTEGSGLACGRFDNSKQAFSLSSCNHSA